MLVSRNCPTQPRRVLLFQLITALSRLGTTAALINLEECSGDSSTGATNKIDNSHTREETKSKKHELDQATMQDKRVVQ